MSGSSSGGGAFTRVRFSPPQGQLPIYRRELAFSFFSPATTVTELLFLAHRRVVHLNDLWQVGLTESSTQDSENLIEFGQACHLIRQTSRPEGLKPGLLVQNGRLNAAELFPTKFQFLPHRFAERRPLDGLVRRQIPQVVEISRFVSRSVRQCNRFFRHDFIQRIDLEPPVRWISSNSS
jgi:hypothetical protein